ncbi:hypothetical protein [Nocardioides sp. YIM 152588]|uniref:hypothetical protein n=1 Tax=Nocardioides sp. YIM 152588 TaxID=3158259 RepID=UPI0032E36D88
MTNPRTEPDGVPLTSLDDRLHDLLRALARVPDLPAYLRFIRTTADLALASVSPDDPDAAAHVAMASISTALAAVGDEVHQLTQMKKEGA